MFYTNLLFELLPEYRSKFGSEISYENFKGIPKTLKKLKSQNYYLFQDISSFNKSKDCTKFDRYGVCNNIYDNNNKIFIGRDPNFPW